MQILHINVASHLKNAAVELICTTPVFAAPNHRRIIVLVEINPEDGPRRRIRNKKKKYEEVSNER